MKQINSILLSFALSLSTINSFELGASASHQKILNDALNCAVKSHDIVEVQNLLTAKANPSAPDTGGITTLHAAACVSNPDIINLLADARTDINPSNCHGYTPLHEAVRGNQIKIVQALITKRANPELQESLGLTPLDLATQMGHLTTAMVLIKAGARLYPATKIKFAQKLTSVICYAVPLETRQQEHENSWLYLLRLSRFISKLPNKETIIGNSIIWQAWMHYKPHPSLIELCQLVVIEQLNKPHVEQLPTKNLELDEEELKYDQQAASGSSWPCFLS